MVRRKSSTADKDKKAYEKALAKYLAAYWAYEDNKTDSTRRSWQKSMTALLDAYSKAIDKLQWTQNIPLDWVALVHLSYAMRTVIDGKDADLFHVTPSDRYDSGMRFSKAIAVGHVVKGKTKESQ